MPLTYEPDSCEELLQKIQNYRLKIPPPLDPDYYPEEVNEEYIVAYRNIDSFYVESFVAVKGTPFYTGIGAKFEKMAVLYQKQTLYILLMQGSHVTIIC